MESYIDSVGQTWVTGELLTFGAYSGAGSIAKANIRFIIERGDIECETVYKYRIDCNNIYFYNDNIETIEIFSDAVFIRSFCGETLFIKESKNTKELLSSLSDYPVFDDELLGSIEIEMESKAFWDGIVYDLLSFGSKNFYNFFCTHMEKYSEIIFESYRSAMEETNTYPLFEYDTVYIDTQRIGTAFINSLLSAFAEYHKQRWKEKPYKNSYIYLPGIAHLFQ